MNSHLSHRNSFRKLLTTRIRLLIIFFSILFVFTAVASNILQAESTRFLKKLFHDGAFMGRGFSIFDMVVIFISSSVIKHVGVNFAKQSWQEKCIYITSILYVVILTVNPNNYSIVGGVANNITFLLFLYAFILIKDNLQYIHLIRRIIEVVSIFVVIRAVILIISSLLGLTSTKLWGFSSALMEDDTLYIFSFFGVIFLLSYFLTQKKKYFIAWFIIFLLQILSFRRAGFFLIIFPSLFLFIIYYTRMIRLYKKIIIGLFSASVISLFLTGSIPISNKTITYFYRNFGAFLPETIIYVPTYDYVQNLHFEQAEYAIYTAFYVLDFWGKGYGKEELDQFDYAGRGIHNAFVQVWMKHGLLAFLYYVFIAFLLLLEILSYLKHYKEWGKDYYLIKGCLLVYLVLFFTALWMNAIYLLTETKMVVFRILLIISLYKITPDNYKLLLSRKKV